MKNYRKYLRRTNYLRKTLAILLSVLIIFTTVISVLTIAFMPLNNTATPDEATPDEIIAQSTTKGTHLVTDKKWETIVPSTSSTEKSTEKVTDPTEVTETNSIIPAKNEKVETENKEVEVTDNDYYEYISPDINTKSAGNHLIDIDNPDYSYKPQVINLSSADRELAARVIMGEFGSYGYEACCLIAQSMRDGMIRSNCSSIQELINTYQYYGYNSAPNQDSYNAVDFIFYSGGLAVPHRILYMYSTSLTYSSWHESQRFVVQYGVVRFFDAW